MAGYVIDFDAVNKLQGQLTEQIEELGKTLDDMVNIQESMLGAAQWNTADRADFDQRFQSFIESGRQLQSVGTAQADALQKISDTYRSVEQG